MDADPPVKKMKKATTTNLEAFAVAVARLKAKPRGETGKTFAFSVGSVEATASAAELVETGEAMLALDDPPGRGDGEK